MPVRPKFWRARESWRHVSIWYVPLPREHLVCSTSGISPRALGQKRCLILVSYHSFVGFEFIVVCKQLGHHRRRSARNSSASARGFLHGMDREQAAGWFMTCQVAWCVRLPSGGGIRAVERHVKPDCRNFTSWSCNSGRSALMITLICSRTRQKSGVTSSKCLLVCSTGDFRVAERHMWKANSAVLKNNEHVWHSNLKIQNN